MWVARPAFGCISAYNRHGKLVAIARPYAKGLPQWEQPFLRS
jgi:hypothetical protein